MLNIKKYLSVFDLGILPGIRPVFFILISSLLLNNYLYTQENLVPNGSFEEYDACPTGTADFSGVKYWYNPTLASPDYYNVCAGNNGAGVPSNDWGWQHAQDGVAYAGIGIDAYFSPQPNYREYIQVQLKQPLEKGQLYCWSFYVSLLDNIDYASNNISLAFSEDSVLLSSGNILPLVPFYQSDKVILDSINWTLLSGQYDAHGGEKFLTIGNFSNIGSTNMVKLRDNSLGGPASYYYIDNVFIGKCKTTIQFPNIFTPNKDGVNDIFRPTFKGIRDYQLTVLNRWGNVVFYNESPSIGWDGKYKEENCTDGIYFYKCNYIDEDNKENSKTGFVHLIR